MARLFGLDITSLNQSIDMVSGESSISIELESCSVDQVFDLNGVNVGDPVSFTFGTNDSGDRSYFGILDRFTRDNSPDESYSVFLTNGINILDGCQLILSDYYGVSTEVPNLYNINGYLGFDSVAVGSNGVHVNAILQSLVELTSLTAENDFGQPIKYRGHKYYLGFENLPILTEHYKINQQSISLMEAIREIYKLYGFDFYVSFEEPDSTDMTNGFSGKFIIKGIDRNGDVDINVIQKYIDSQSCIVSKNLGYEDRKAVHNKFILGPNIEYLFYNTPQNRENNIITDGITKAEYADDTVLPYFGTDADDNAIVGYNLSKSGNYMFEIDVTDIDHPFLGRTYLTSLDEIRAVKAGRDSWERFLSENNGNQYMIDQSVADVNEIVSWKPFLLPISTIDYNNIPEEDRPPSWMVGPEIGDYTPLGIIKFGYSAAKANRKSLANGYYPNTGAVTGRISAGNSRICHYPATSQLNPYFGRAAELRMINGWSFGFARMFEFDLQERAKANRTNDGFFVKVFQDFKNKGSLNNTRYETMFPSIKKGSLTDDLVSGSLSEANSQLYAKLRDLAENYYNKKFMVSIPFTDSSTDPDTGKIKLTQETTSTGYLDQSVWEEAVNTGLVPPSTLVNKLVDDKNKFYPYVKYEDAFLVDINTEKILEAKYDLSEISESEKVVYYNPSKIITKDVEYPSGLSLDSGDEVSVADVWVKCDVESDIQFLNRSTTFSPRAIITLPNPAGVGRGHDVKTVKGKKALVKTIEKIGKIFAYEDLSDTEIETITGKTLDHIGSDEAIFADGEDIALADVYAIPLKNNLVSYGPWQIAKSGVEDDTGVSTDVPLDGPVEFVRDEKLAPWNYGGFENLSIAAKLSLQQNVTSQPYDGTGSIEVFGLPTIQTGESLAVGMPPVTDITINEGSNGTTTTYNFQIWSDHRSLGAARQYHIRKIEQQQEQLTDLKRNLKEQLSKVGRTQITNISNNTKFNDLNKSPKRHQNNTSYPMVSGESGQFGNTVVIQPTYNAGSQTLSDYENKAVMSLDGLLSPFSTKDHVLLPSWKDIDPDNSGDEPSSQDLNPFAEGDPTSLITRGSNPSILEMTDPNLIDRDSINARGIGLRGPLIISGWGFDTAGKPVPADTGDEDAFHPEYRNNPALWKSGPLDARWDEERGVWVAGGTGTGTSIGDGETTVADSSGCCKHVTSPDIELSDGTLTTRKRILCEQLGDITERQDNGTLVITFPEPSLMPLEKEDDSDLFYWEIPEEQFSATDIYGSGIELDAPSGAVSFIHYVEDAAYCGCPKMRFRIEWDALIPDDSGLETDLTAEEMVI